MSNAEAPGGILGNSAATPATQQERFEKIRTLVRRDSSVASRELAAEVSAWIRKRQEEGKTFVLGLATGSTPVPFYRELIRLHRDEGLSFENVITFNLDEYYGLQRDHPESYRGVGVRFFNIFKFRSRGGLYGGGTKKP